MSIHIIAFDYLMIDRMIVLLCNVRYNGVMEVTVIIMQSKTFCSQMRQNEMKFGLDRMFEFKKSFKLYCQTSVRVAAKVAKFFVHFTWYARK
jgi:hypothetical protein